MSEAVSAQTLRKRKSRAAQEAKGFDRLDVVLGQSVVQDLDALLVARGGWSGQYDKTEYINSLIRADRARLDQQLTAPGACPLCLKALPAGCGGEFKTDVACAGWVLDKALKVPV